MHVSRLYAAAGVDLVEVNAKADPPVCRLRDSVQMEKKEAERKSKAQKQARVDKGQMKKKCKVHIQCTCSRWKTQCTAHSLIR